MQVDIAQYYETNYPGQVQVIGVDEWDGTASQLRSFGGQIGATFPLLLNGAAAAGGNFTTLYGTWDNYVVVNKQGIVRYHAKLIWPHGDRYHLNEIRGTVDTLVTSLVGVDPHPVPERPSLASAPNPARGGAIVELAIPVGSARHARVTVHDVAGRQVATLWEGPLAPGTARFRWSHLGADGAKLRPGVYLILAEAGDLRLTHRAVVLP